MKYTKVTVDPVTDWKVQCKDLGIDTYFDNFTDIGKVQTKPYVAHLREAEEFQGKSPDYVRRHLKEEQGATVYEAIAYYKAKLKDKDEYYLDIVGSSVESGNLPYLYHWYGRPRLSAYWGDGANGYFRPLVKRESGLETGKLGTSDKLAIGTKISKKHDHKWKWLRHDTNRFTGFPMDVFYCPDDLEKKEI